MSTATLDVNELMQSITIRVKGLRVLSFRLWLAAHLFAFAGWVAGCNVEIEAGE